MMAIAHMQEINARLRSLERKPRNQAEETSMKNDLRNYREKWDYYLGILKQGVDKANRNVATSDKISTDTLSPYW